MITITGQYAVQLVRDLIISAGRNWVGVFVAAVSGVALFLTSWRFLYFRIWSWLHPKDPAELPYWIPCRLPFAHLRGCPANTTKFSDMHFLTSRMPMGL